MKIYAIIDTNVIISAFLTKHPDSATIQLLDYIFDRTLIPIFNEEILREYSQVLRRPKFNFSEQKITAILEAIQQSGITAERITSNENLPDPKDIVFYEVKLAVEGSYLVTGNIKHFPKKPFVVTPSEMVRIINETLFPSGLLNDSDLAKYK